MPGIAALIIGALAAAAGYLSSTSPFQRTVNYTLNKLLPTQELEVSALVELYLRGHIDLSTLKDRLKQYGYNATRVEEMLKLTKRIFTIDQAIYAWRRGIINDVEFKEIMEANGVPFTDLDKWLKVYEFFPSPQDLIRFAVREVFTPEIVEKYRMYEDLPPQYLELAKQVGIPEEIAKWYWYAHWDLPSLTMGFEMFRRKIIDAEELKTLMRTLDIMPAWRDKLLQLAYEIPTRVDVRRMYEMGVIDRNKVKEYYEKMGYTPEDAEILTQWTEIEYASEDRTLTVKQILELYELGEFTREEAIEQLRKLGYPPDVAEYKVTLYEHERLLKEAREQLQLLVEMYKAGAISWEDLIDAAYKLPFSPTTIQRTLVRAYREKEAKIKLPSLSTLKKWLKLEIITPEEFKDYLKRMGYRDKDIENYMKEVGLLPLENLTSPTE